ncbi:hypothetical protein GCM10009546_14670 [Actinomadura livida]|uniref:Uncharacterized protein n=1 Tax=Actinomadura livida TaxID=79909 RepID=A0ABP3NW64_9ACTN
MAVTCGTRTSHAMRVSYVPEPAKAGLSLALAPPERRTGHARETVRRRPPLLAGDGGAPRPSDGVVAAPEPGEAERDERRGEDDQPHQGCDGHVTAR